MTATCLLSSVFENTGCLSFVFENNCGLLTRVGAAASGLQTAIGSGNPAALIDCQASTMGGWEGETY